MKATATTASPAAGGSQSGPSRRAASLFRRTSPAATPEVTTLAHAVLLCCVLTGAALAEGGTIAPAWLACQSAAGLLLASWTVTAWRPARSVVSPRRLAAALLVMPLYAAFQAVPLPLDLVSWISPAKAELYAGVSALAPEIPRWTALSVDPRATADFAARLASYGCVFWVVRGLCSRLGRWRFAMAAPIVLVAVIEASIGLAQSAAGEATRGSYVNRNHLAGLLGMALPFAVVAAVAVWERPPDNTRVRAAGWSALAGFSAVLVAAGILATKSRAGLLASLVSLLVAGALALKRSGWGRDKSLAAALFVVALVGAAFVYLPSDNLVRRYGHLVERGLASEGRLLLWRETLDLVAAYPLAGCGFGAYEAAFLRYKKSAPMVTDTHAHNDYLELMAEAGAAGFVLCIVLVGAPVVTALRAALEQSHRDAALALGCAGSIAAILAHSVVDFNLRIPANGMVFVWVLGLCAACGGRTRHDAAGGGD